MSDAGVDEERDRRARVARGGLVWEADVRGTICHQVIAELCRQRIRDRAGIAPVAVALLPPRLAVVHRRALLSFVVSMAGMYLRHFARRGWRFLGSEVIVGGIALDLLWQRGSRLEADEVKSSVTTPDQWRDRALAQATAQAVAGRAAYGDVFAGVRVTPLAWPEQAFFVAS